MMSFSLILEYEGKIHNSNRNEKRASFQNCFFMQYEPVIS